MARTLSLRASTGQNPSMRVDLLTREYPPEVYGGAGVHVEYLARELRRLVDVRVHCMGAPRDEAGVTAYGVPDGAGRRQPGAAHSRAPTCRWSPAARARTWCTRTPGTPTLAGHLAKLLYGVPHVMSAHSLEPLRPWKAEQLGGGYALSSWAEQTAIEAADAVDRGVGRDARRRAALLPGRRPRPGARGAQRHRHRGVPARHRYRRCCERHGIDPDRPSVVFVGRITRQKGLPHLLRAALSLDPSVQLVLCAGSPDTDEILAEVTVLVEELRRDRDGVVWIQEMLPKPDVIQVLTHATVFACPSVYEPMGIVNLEAMACEVPVVATATGGIPEVVADGETGLLVPIEQQNDGSGTPLDTSRFEADLAAALSQVLADPAAGPRDGRGRAAPRGRGVLLGDDRHPDAGPLPRAALRVRPRPARCRRPRGLAGPPCPGRAATSGAGGHLVDGHRRPVAGPGQLDDRQ